MKRRSNTRNFEFEWSTDETPTGKEWDVHVTVKIIHDSNYGSDADGNRGMPMDFLEDLDFTILEGENDITKKVEVEYPKVYAEIEAKSEEKAWEHEPEEDGRY